MKLKFALGELILGTIGFAMVVCQHSWERSDAIWAACSGFLICHGMDRYIGESK